MRAYYQCAPGAALRLYSFITAICLLFIGTGHVSQGVAALEYSCQPGQDDSPEEACYLVRRPVCTAHLEYARVGGGNNNVEEIVRGLSWGNTRLVADEIKALGYRVYQRIVKEPGSGQRVVRESDGTVADSGKDKATLLVLLPTVKGLTEFSRPEKQRSSGDGVEGRSGLTLDFNPTWEIWAIPFGVQDGDAAQPPSGSCGWDGSNGAPLWATGTEKNDFVHSSQDGYCEVGPSPPLAENGGFAGNIEDLSTEVWRSNLNLGYPWLNLFGGVHSALLKADEEGALVEEYSDDVHTLNPTGSLQSWTEGTGLGSSPNALNEVGKSMDEFHCEGDKRAPWKIDQNDGDGGDDDCAAGQNWKSTGTGMHSRIRPGSMMVKGREGSTIRRDSLRPGMQVRDVKGTKRLHVNPQTDAAQENAAVKSLRGVFGVQWRGLRLCAGGFRPRCEGQRDSTGKPAAAFSKNVTLCTGGLTGNTFTEARCLSNLEHKTIEACLGDGEGTWEAAKCTRPDGSRYENIADRASCEGVATKNLGRSWVPASGWRSRAAECVLQPAQEATNSSLSESRSLCESVGGTYFPETFACDSRQSAHSPIQDFGDGTWGIRSGIPLFTRPSEEDGMGATATGAFLAEYSEDGPGDSILRFKRIGGDKDKVKRDSSSFPPSRTCRSTAPNVISGEQCRSALIDRMHFSDEMERHCFCEDAFEILLTGGDWHVVNSTGPKKFNSPKPPPPEKTLGSDSTEQSETVLSNLDGGRRRLSSQNAQVAAADYPFHHGCADTFPARPKLLPLGLGFTASSSERYLVKFGWPTGPELGGHFTGFVEDSTSPFNDLQLLQWPNAKKEKANQIHADFLEVQVSVAASRSHETYFGFPDCYECADLVKDKMCAKLQRCGDENNWNNMDVQCLQQLLTGKIENCDMLTSSGECGHALQQRCRFVTSSPQQSEDESQENEQGAELENGLVQYTETIIETPKNSFKNQISAKLSDVPREPPGYPPVVDTFVTIGTIQAHKKWCSLVTGPMKDAAPRCQRCTTKLDCPVDIFGAQRLCIENPPKCSNDKSLKTLCSDYHLHEGCRPYFNMTDASGASAWSFAITADERAKMPGAKATAEGKTPSPIWVRMRLHSKQDHGGPGRNDNKTFKGVGRWSSPVPVTWIPETRTTGKSCSYKVDECGVCGGGGIPEGYCDCAKKIPVPSDQRVSSSACKTLQSLTLVPGPESDGNDPGENSDVENAGLLSPEEAEKELQKLAGLAETINIAAQPQNISLCYPENLRKRLYANSSTYPANSDESETAYPCSGYGDCLGEDAAAKCSCRPGFWGSVCEMPVEVAVARFNSSYVDVKARPDLFKSHFKSKAAEALGLGSSAGNLIDVYQLREGSVIVVFQILQNRSVGIRLLNRLVTSGSKIMPEQIGSVTVLEVDREARLSELNSNSTRDGVIFRKFVREAIIRSVLNVVTGPANENSTNPRVWRVLAAASERPEELTIESQKALAIQTNLIFRNAERSSRSVPSETLDLAIRIISDTERALALSFDENEKKAIRNLVRNKGRSQTFESLKKIAINLVSSASSVSDVAARLTTVDDIRGKQWKVPSYKLKVARASLNQQTLSPHTIQIDGNSVGADSTINENALFKLPTEVATLLSRSANQAISAAVGNSPGFSPGDMASVMEMHYVHWNHNPYQATEPQSIRNSKEYVWADESPSSFSVASLRLRSPSYDPTSTTIAMKDSVINNLTNPILVKFPVKPYMNLVNTSTNLQLLNETVTSVELVCVWWDTEKLLWSEEGCDGPYNQSEDAYMVCTCTHLTAFGIRLKNAGEKNAQIFSQISDEKFLTTLTSNTVALVFVVGVITACLVMISFSIWFTHHRRKSLQKKILSIKLAFSPSPESQNSIAEYTNPALIKSQKAKKIEEMRRASLVARQKSSEEHTGMQNETRAESNEYFSSMSDIAIDSCWKTIDSLLEEFAVDQGKHFIKKLEHTMSHNELQRRPSSIGIFVREHFGKSSVKWEDSDYKAALYDDDMKFDNNNDNDKNSDDGGRYEEQILDLVDSVDAKPTRQPVLRPYISGAGDNEESKYSVVNQTRSESTPTQELRSSSTMSKFDSVKEIRLEKIPIFDGARKERSSKQSGKHHLSFKEQALIDERESGGWMHRRFMQSLKLEHEWIAPWFINHETAFYSMPSRFLVLACVILGQLVVESLVYDVRFPHLRQTCEVYKVENETFKEWFNYTFNEDGTINGTLRDPYASDLPPVPIDGIPITEALLLSVVVAVLSIPLPMIFFNINLKLAKSLRNERVFEFAGVVNLSKISTYVSTKCLVSRNGTLHGLRTIVVRGSQGTKYLVDVSDLVDKTEQVKCMTICCVTEVLFEDNSPINSAYVATQLRSSTIHEGSKHNLAVPLSDQPATKQNESNILHSKYPHTLRVKNYHETFDLHFGKRAERDHWKRILDSIIDNSLWTGASTMVEMEIARGAHRKLKNRVEAASDLRGSELDFSELHLLLQRSLEWKHQATKQYKYAMEHEKNLTSSKNILKEHHERAALRMFKRRVMMEQALRDEPEEEVAREMYACCRKIYLALTSPYSHQIEPPLQRCALIFLRIVMVVYIICCSFWLLLFSVCNGSEKTWSWVTSNFMMMAVSAAIMRPGSLLTLNVLIPACAARFGKRKESALAKNEYRKKAMKKRTMSHESIIFRPDSAVFDEDNEEFFTLTEAIQKQHEIT